MGKCLTKADRPETKELSTIDSKTLSSDHFKPLKLIQNFPKSEIARRSIMSSLLKSPLFRNLSSEDLENILKKVNYCVAEADQMIFTQGDTGNLYFIINSGRVQVIVDGKPKGILEAESSFGEMALLSDSIRKASILTLCKSSFWVLTGEDFCKSLKSLYRVNFDHIRQLVSNSIVFKNLNDAQIDLISKIAIKVTFQDQEKIIREGDKGDLIYILNKGCVSFKKETEEYMRISKSGDIFGEGSLLTGDTRKATCVSIGPSELISINFMNIKSILGPNLETLLLQNLSKNSLTSDSHLNFLSKDFILKICENLEWKKYKDSEIVLTKTSEHFSTLFIICTGCIRHVTNPNSQITSYQVIGLNNENEQIMKEGDYIALSETIVSRIDLEMINQLLKIDCFELIGKLDKLRLLRSISFFNCLSEESANFLAERMKEYVVIPGTKIFTCEDRGGKVYIVKSGVFEVYNSEKKLVRIVKGFEVFGERCLYEEKRSASVICIEKAEMYNVARSDIRELKELPELIQIAKRKEYYQRKVSLDFMKVVREYVSSQGRRRYCIKDPFDKLRYELIVIPMASLDSKRECFKLIQERDIMIQIEHRQLVKLVCSSYNHDSVFFITEHIKGNSLISLLPVNLKITKHLALYFAKMIEYLHEKNIAYRDFCTENIIISSNGIPYLYNFRSAKVVENRTYTRVGNPFIRSPEMILGRGYTKSTDIWSLGVVLFELVYNKLPFKIQNNDSPVEAYEKILNLSHGFSDFIHLDLNKLLESMLSTSDLRIDVSGILRNHWFSDVEKDFLKKRPTLCDNVFGIKVKEEKRNKKVFKANKLLQVFGI